MINKSFSLNNRLKNISQKKLLALWIFYHAAIVLFFLISLLIFKGKIHIDSDLFNLVPKNLSMESVKKADEKMMSVTSQNFFILVENEVFENAKQDAVSVYNELKDSDNFDSISLYSDTSSISEITDFLYKYRYNLIDENTIDTSINQSGAIDFSLNSLSTAYSGFTMLPLDNLESDPFLLTEFNLQNYLKALQNAGTAMSVTDGVLSSKYEGKYYVMIRGILSPKGAVLASKKGAVAEIYNVCNKISGSENSANKSEFIFSGTPFHSYESSNSASKEISIIATISMLIVILLLFFIFRSPKPLIFSVASILISIGIAFIATLATFHNMHVITLVFGTSLIGSCIDYSLHFFTHWAGNSKLKSSIEIRNHIFSGLIMAILSTGICFAILLFAPFTILKQMSLFCLSGLISSFLTTIAIYPYIKLPEQQNRKPVRFVTQFSKLVSVLQKKTIGRSFIILLFLFSIVSIAVCHKNVKIQNNLLSLYDMKGKLLNDEITASQIIQYTPGGWYIVSGNTEEEALENEEKLRKEFEQLTENKVGYVSTTSFIPSKKMQDKSINACSNLMALSELQFEYLGFTEDESKKYSGLLKQDYEKSKNHYVSFSENNIPDYITSAISSVWLGEIEGKYYTVLLPSRVTDYTNYRSLVDNNENAFFISKSQDISHDLDKLTFIVFKFFLIASVLMFIMLKLFYSWKQSFKIISVPFLIILVTSAFYAIFKINIEFFSITGLILVFGLGLDYVIYMIENEKKINLKKDENPLEQEEKTLEPFATMISFVTTIISFGALALSSFKPVHYIGLSIFIGLFTAYLSSFFYGRLNSKKESVENINE